MHGHYTYVCSRYNQLLVTLVCSCGPRLCALQHERQVTPYPSLVPESTYSCSCDSAHWLSSNLARLVTFFVITSSSWGYHSSLTWIIYSFFPSVCKAMSYPTTFLYCILQAGIHLYLYFLKICENFKLESSSSTNSNFLSLARLLSTTRTYPCIHPKS